MKSLLRSFETALFALVHHALVAAVGTSSDLMIAASRAFEERDAGTNEPLTTRGTDFIGFHNPSDNTSCIYI